MEDRFIILPSFALEPNKLSTFNRIFDKNRMRPDGSYVQRKRENNNIVRSSHNFNISDNAYRSLKRKINWLYYLAKSQHVKTYNGKDIYNFKIGFHTFTLPSSQRHSTKEITQNLFNQMLTELRQRTKMKNYVWRLEFQKNTNVHFHLVTDVYIDYFLVQSIWNRILLKAGYIAEYKAKFSNLSLSEYNKLTNANGKTDFSIIAKRYAKGCAQNWENPNTVDSKSVTNRKNIANYISKYFGKNPSNKSIYNALDTAENSANLRLWFCSRSLSKLNSVTDFCEAYEIDLFSIITNIKNVRTKVFKYARLFYFEFKNCVEFQHKILHGILRDYATKQGYFNGI